MITLQFALLAVAVSLHIAGDLLWWCFRKTMYERSEKEFLKRIFAVSKSCLDVLICAYISFGVKSVLPPTWL